MTTRRRVLGIGVAIALLIGIVAAVLLVPRQPPLERAFDRIEMGMSAAEVRAVVGDDPWKVTRWHEGFHRALESGLIAAAGADVSALGDGNDLHGWESSDDLLIVVFDRDATVIRKQLSRTGRLSWLERLRGWLGL